jgi:hypothetical protein
MAVTRGIVIASFGDRDGYLSSMLANVRKYTHLPVMVYTDRERNYVSDYQDMSREIVPEKKLLWRDSPRWGVRNANLWLAKAASETFDICCCLNDDMRIVSKQWTDGLLLAERFGVCVPMNPRVYVKHNALGADATQEDYHKAVSELPGCAPACNISPMFVCRLNDAARRLMIYYLDELKTCMRGTLAFWFASWKSGITPLYLPEQWCVCASNAKYIRDYKKVLQGKEVRVEPIMLHWGQQEVRNVFKDWPI